MYDDAAGVDTSESSLATSTHGRSELEINDLFLQASQAFESSSAQHHQQPCTMALHKPSSITSRFAMLKTDEEVLSQLRPIKIITGLLRALGS